MRAAIVQVDFDLVAKTLFGREARLHRARPSFNSFGENVIDLVIEHPDLPEVEKGMVLQTKTVVVHSELGKPDHVEFV